MAFFSAIGRIGREPEMKYTTTGKQFWLFSIADIDLRRTKDGNDETQWWRCIYFSHNEKDGENFKTLVRVGAMLSVRGELNQDDPYTGNDGVRKSGVQVKVDKWKLVVSAEKPKDAAEKPAKDEQKPPQQQEKLPYSEKPPADGEFKESQPLPSAPDDDDLPF